LAAGDGGRELQTTRQLSQPVGETPCSTDWKASYVERFCSGRHGRVILLT